MPKKKYVIDLTSEERAMLEQLTRRGRARARKLTRARLLLKADEGLSDAEIAAALDAGIATVGWTRQRFVEEGLAALEEALQSLDTTGTRKSEAELYGLKGELLWRAGNRAAEAEACLRHALTIAPRQQAKSWELRAALSLCRLWQQQGKRTKAHGLLAPIYGWFTEGFATADLQEAKALLEELS